MNNKINEIIEFIEKDDNLNIVYDLIIKKDIHMFKYIDKDVFNEFIKDVESEAVEDYILDISAQNGGGF